MPQKANIWGVKNLKKVNKKVFNHGTGEYETISEKRCTGTVEFPVLAVEAGIYEDSDIYIYTKAEHESKQSEAKSPEVVNNEINDKLDSAMALLIEIAKLKVEGNND